MSLICFIGVIGSGKSYQCQQLADDGYLKISIADGLRELLWGTLGWKPETQEAYDLLKTTLFMSDGMAFRTLESLCRTNGLMDYYDRIMDELGRIKNRGMRAALHHQINGRQLLQNVGETAKHLFGRDCWAEIWKDRVAKLLIENKALVCTDDIRFPEEVEAAMELKAQFVFCDHQSKLYNNADSHISERLAQRLIVLDKYEDGDTIEYEDLKQISKDFYTEKYVEQLQG